MKIDNLDEQHRRECEAREWLRRGYTTPDKVNGLMDRIAARRGREAAEQLRQQMRIEHKKGAHNNENG